MYPYRCTYKDPRISVVYESVSPDPSFRMCQMFGRGSRGIFGRQENRRTRDLA